MTTYEKGQFVSIDTDNAEWGRVCGKGYIEGRVRGGYLVNALSIRADIVVKEEDIGEVLSP